MAKTNDPNLFLGKNKGRCDLENNAKILKYTDEKMVELFSSKFEKIVDSDQQKQLTDVLNSHYLARLSLKDSILLYIYNRFYYPWCKEKWFCWTW